MLDDLIRQLEEEDLVNSSRKDKSNSAIRDQADDPPVDRNRMPMEREPQIDDFSSFEAYLDAIISQQKTKTGLY